MLRPSAARANSRRDFTRSISDSSSWAQALSEVKKVSHLVALLSSLNESAPRTAASDGHLDLFSFFGFRLALYVAWVCFAWFYFLLEPFFFLADWNKSPLFWVEDQTKR